MIYSHQLRVPGTASPTLAPQRPLRWGHENQHESGVSQGSGIRGQSGGAVRAQQAPGLWFNSGPVTGVHPGQGQPQRFLSSLRCPSE